MSEKATWYCKIGEVDREVLGTDPADPPMREAIERAFKRIAGEDAKFCFSGWGAELTEAERAVVEDRQPIPRTAVYSAGFPFMHEHEELVTFGGKWDKYTYPPNATPAEGILTFNSHIWRVMECPSKLVVAISVNDDFLAQR